MKKNRISILLWIALTIWIGSTMLLWLRNETAWGGVWGVRFLNSRVDEMLNDFGIEGLINIW